MTMQAQADQEADRMRKMVEERRHQRAVKEVEVSGLREVNGGTKGKG